MKNKINYFLILIITSAIIVRFYDYGNRINFWSEQARSLIVASQYLEKPSLLGQEYFRTTSTGHKLFASAYFNYSLLPLLVLTGYNPLLITVYFSLLNIITGVVVYWVTKKILKDDVPAMIAILIFLFNSYMIYHSLFIWILNYLPLIGILSLYYFWQLKITGKSKYAFLLGLLSGIGFGLEYLFLLFAAGLLVLSLIFVKNRILNTIVFATGGIVGVLPMLIFDLKHDFYHMSTLYRFAIDVFSAKQPGAQLIYYHFLHFWPLVIIIAALLLSKLYLRSKWWVLLLLLVYLFVNLFSPKVSFTKALGMPENLSYIELIKAVSYIRDQNPDNYTVASTLDFDKRAYVIRYMLQYYYQTKLPHNVEDYKSPRTIFILTTSDFDIEKSDIWEIQQFLPGEIVDNYQVNSHYRIMQVRK